MICAQPCRGHQKSLDACRALSLLMVNNVSPYSSFHHKNMVHNRRYGSIGPWSCFSKNCLAKIPPPDKQHVNQKPKKHLNQTFGGNFVDRKFWGNFGQWGIQKKFRCSGFAVSFFHYGGGMPPIMKKWDCKPWTPKLFFDPPLAKISANFSVYKIFPKSLV